MTLRAIIATCGGRLHTPQRGHSMPLTGTVNGGNASAIATHS